MEQFITILENYWPSIVVTGTQILALLATTVGVIKSIRNVFTKTRDTSDTILTNLKVNNDTNYKNVENIINTKMNDIDKMVSAKFERITNDIGVMAEITTNVILAKGIGGSTKKEVVALSNKLNNENVRKLIENAITTEQKVAENLQGVQLGKPIEIPTPATNKAPVSTQAKSTYISNSQ